MEIEIFTWTGRIILWSICLCTISGCIVAPIFVFFYSKRRFIHYKITRDLIGSGLKPRDIDWIHYGLLHSCFNKPRPEPEELITWLRKVIDRFEARKTQ